MTSIPMTHDKILRIASNGRGGIVQWYRSGVIEHIYLGKTTGKIYAAHLLTGQFHWLKKRKNYYCREITWGDFVSVGDLVKTVPRWHSLERMEAR